MSPGRLALAALLVAAFAVRVVGIRHGLPFAYNPDEELHFVPHAAAAADGHLDPGYYENPAGLTYLLALVLRVVLLGRSAEAALTEDPTLVLTVARLVVAALGTLLVHLVHRVGTRYFDASVGLVAGAVVAFGFLPVFYSHQALNDVPTLLPVALVLLGAWGLHEEGSLTGALLTGAAVGAAVGFKYLAAPTCLVVAVAVVLRVAQREDGIGRAAVLAAAAGLASVVTLVVLNPFLAIHFGEARGQFLGQSAQAGTAKLGQSGTGWAYYPLSLLWGLGAVPVALALVGTVLAVRTERLRAALLLVFPVALYLSMGDQARFFGRWLLPAYPAVAVLAGYGAVRSARWARRRLPAARPRTRALVLPVVVALTLAQPVADAVRSDIVLVHSDTRTEARAWLGAHLDEGTRIVVEPAVPATYLDGLGLDAMPVERPYQDYERRLDATTVDGYRASGTCWVMVNSHQRDRGLAGHLAGARAYYDRLERESTAEAVFSPYRRGADAPAFSYDFSFDWYPLAYARPGPVIEIRRLTDCPTR